MNEEGVEGSSAGGIEAARIGAKMVKESGRIEGETQEEEEML